MTNYAKERAYNIGPMSPDEILIVSGLPRSGTSMTMQMLAAAKVQILSDGKRAADDSNPNGYFEYQEATRLRKDTTWLAEAQGKAVKLVMQLLPSLPVRLPKGTTDLRYRVIVLDRNLEEILASQSKMLASRETATKPHLAATFEKQIRQVRELLKAREIPVLTLSYEDAIAQPHVAAQRINGFLGGLLDEVAMAAAIKPALHRQRSKPNVT